jgi:hypothetical protein
MKPLIEGNVVIQYSEKPAALKQESNRKQDEGGE